MKRIYTPYHEWEDYKNGMYNTSEIDNDKSVEKSIALLSNQELFFKVSLEMIKSYKNSADNNLTNSSSNRLSWIGQAACNYNHNAIEKNTRIAWSLIRDIDRRLANKTAIKILKIYEESYNRIYKNVGSKMLF